MCNLTGRQREIVVEFVKKKVKLGKPFTGWNVAKAIEAEGLLFLVPSSEISSYVRQMFNDRHSVFQTSKGVCNWVSWPAPGGFLVYGKVPKTLLDAHKKMTSKKRG